MQQCILHRPAPCVLHTATEINATGTTHVKWWYIALWYPDKNKQCLHLGVLPFPAKSCGKLQNLGNLSHLARTRTVPGKLSMGTVVLNVPYPEGKEEEPGSTQGTLLTPSWKGPARAVPTQKPFDWKSTEYLRAHCVFPKFHLNFLFWGTVWRYDCVCAFNLNKNIGQIFHLIHNLPYALRSS